MTAVLGMALTVSACSGSTGAADTSGGAQTTPGSSSSSHAGTSSPATHASGDGDSPVQRSGAPITVVALPSTEQGGAPETSSPPATGDGQSAGTTQAADDGQSTAVHQSSGDDASRTSTPTSPTGDDSTTDPSGAGGGADQVVMPPVATVTASPKLGSTGVAPAERIRLTVHHGTLISLTFTNPDGKKVKGSISHDRTTWTLGEPLGYGKTYTVAGFAMNKVGVQTKIQGTYRTATTVEPVTTSISPGDGAVVGVAAPVIVNFGMDPQDKALVEKHVRIITKPKVEGSWAWITHDGHSYPSLDWRPKKYWPEGTKVRVESNIYGVKFADGWYGGDDVAVNFTIGRNQVVVANAKKHEITIKRDGKAVATYPASFGMGDDPNSEYGLRPSLVTRSGIHVVMDKHPEYLMSNPGYYQDAKEYWAVRISDNGEFIHYNASTTEWQLHNVNKTHGCINLSEADAKAYYDTAIYGDPVEVVGTSVKLGPSDGDIYDWAIPWSTWRTLSALSQDSVIS